MGPTTDSGFAASIRRRGPPTRPICVSLHYDRAVRYLSSEWIAAAADAVERAQDHAPAEPTIVDQHVEDTVSYRVVIETGACSLTVLDDATDFPAEPAADATFHQSHATARAVASGETDAHQAFLLGKIRFEGDVGVLIQRRASFDWLAEVLSPVMAATEF